MSENRKQNLIETKCRWCASSHTDTLQCLYCERFEDYVTRLTVETIEYCVPV